MAAIEITEEGELTRSTPREIAESALGDAVDFKERAMVIKARRAV